MTRQRRLLGGIGSRTCLGGLILVFVTLAVISSRTKRPWSDEGWFGNAGYNLAVHGFMGTTVLEEAGTPFRGIHRHTHWVLPLHLVTQAGWYILTGFSLLSLRMLSTLFGVLALCSWYLIVRHLSGSVGVALLTVGLVGVDYNFVQLGSFGRYDMMCAALGAAGLAAYMALRERYLPYALVLGHLLIAAAGFTHYMGAFAFMALVVLVLDLDRSRIALRDVLLSTLPYLAGLVVWGWYISQDPDSFRAQITANALTSDRLAGLRAPWTALSREITERYAIGFGLGAHSSGHSGPIGLKALVLIAYGAGTIASLAVPGIRRARVARALLILTALCFGLMTLVDGHKQTWYLVHITPLYASLLAVATAHFWERHGRLRPLLALGIVGIVCLQAGGTVYRAVQNTLDRSYNPVVEFLQRTAPKDAVILASAELGFGMGFDRPLIDDIQLGAASGRTPDFIVIEDNYRSTIRAFETERPKVWRFIRRRLGEEFRPIFEHADYVVYRRAVDLASRP